ncbi:hypothetical protein NE237_032335 [Protea cynaroides]|uniref:F-box domain-containing protein n=1 Tax=Protea cynaroides TaxID=273540 RepID=A0A9Q0L2V7_9MAGN|nr:hypothetical protein NE237_032335 [Protea cynaroides]
MIKFEFSFDRPVAVRGGAIPIIALIEGKKELEGEKVEEEEEEEEEGKEVQIAEGEYLMAKAAEEKCVERLEEHQEARGFWYLSLVCKDAFYHLYRYLYKKKNILFSIFHRRILEESRWSDLPEELLGMITLRLFGQDYSSFHDICRTWRSVANPFPLQISPYQSHIPIAQTPWLVYFEEEAHVLNVSHPLCKGNLIEISGLSDSRICCSKDGWLLIWQFSRKVFFFNPFNKTRIELPDFPREQWDYPSSEYTEGHMGKGVFVFVLDLDVLIWDHVQHLEDHMFFSNGQNSFSAKTVDPFNEMGNKIYFPIFPLSCDGSSIGGDISSCVFFSLSTGMYHSFGTSLSSGDISRMKILRNCAWVEPNFVIPSNKDLIWAKSEM